MVHCSDAPESIEHCAVDKIELVDGVLAPACTRFSPSMSGAEGGFSCPSAFTRPMFGDQAELVITFL
jgi:hypothetical protein